MFNFRNRNADYCSVMAKAASMLGQSTADARHRVYERARSAVLAEMKRAYPPLDQSDIVAAQMCLEAAIKEIEADALRSQRAQTALHMTSTVSSRSEVLGPANHERRRAPIMRRWVRVFRPAGDRVRFRGKVLSDHSSGETGKGRDPWLTDLLARASREVEEDDQELRRLPR
jgi:hypothetical protein